MSPGPMDISGSTQTLAAQASLSGLQALEQLGQSIDDCVAQRTTDGLAESLAPRLADLRRISEAGILVQTIWRLEEVAKGSAPLTLPEAEGISQQIRGTLTFLGQPPAEAEPAKKAARASLAVYGQTPPARSETENIGRSELLRSIIESLTHPFYVINIATRRVVLANSASGIDLTVPDVTCHVQTHGQPQGLPSDVVCPMNEVLRTRRPVVVEHLHINPQGERRNVEVHAFPLFDDNGNVVHMIEWVLDITDRRTRHDAEIRRVKAEENAQAIQFISRGLGHDLNNALMALIHAVTFFQMGKVPGDDILQGADMSLHRMGRLVRGLLELGKPPSTGIPFDINEELETADLGGLLEDRLGLILNLDPNPWLVPGPEEQVTRVFSNLVTNARDAMKNSPLKRLSLTSEKVSLSLDQVMEDKTLYGWGGKPGDFMRIRFLDSGPGIPEHIIDRIFDVGFSTKKKSQVGDDGNHGLGLALVRKIVSDTGGFVTVQNSPKGGAQFDVYLPRAPS